MTGYVLHLDESIRWRLIAVGGFVTAFDDVHRVGQAWKLLRDSLGLRADESLKWNYGQNDATRHALEERGWSKARRADAVVKTIAQMPVTLMVDVLADERRGTRGPLDFYRYGVDYVCVGFRNFVCWERRSPGPHVVVVDTPSRPPKPKPGTDDSAFDWLKDRENIWHVRYQERFINGIRTASSTVPPLCESGFYPTLLVSQARFNPMLQIADAIAGLALDFAEYNLKGFRDTGSLPEVGWQDRSLSRLVHLFRSGKDGTIKKYGFTLFPDSIPGGRKVSSWLDRMRCDGPIA